MIMTYIIWLQSEECIGLKTGRGRVSLRWEGASGLEGMLHSCPKKGGSKDVIVLCEDVINLPVHLPIQPGKEPEDREALRESLRWEAEPLLGYSPAGAPFDFSAGVSRNGAVGGSEWWITSVEPSIYNAWQQACRQTGFKLRCAMDPWTALASCLPDGNHLLVHKERVILAQLRSGHMVTFKTWRRPKGCPPGGNEWVDGVMNSMEWSFLHDEVHLMDLCGDLDTDATIEALKERTEIDILPATVKGDNEEPWCRLLAGHEQSMLKGKAAMPAARTVKTVSTGPGAMEIALYAIMAVALIAGLGYWYYLDSSALQDADRRFKAQASSITAVDAQNKAKDLAAQNQMLTQEHDRLTRLQSEATWRRKLPGEILSLLANHAVQWDETHVQRVSGGMSDKNYTVVISGETSSHKEVLDLTSDIDETDFGRPAYKADPYGPSIPINEAIGPYSISIKWPPLR